MMVYVSTQLHIICEVLVDEGESVWEQNTLDELLKPKWAFSKCIDAVAVNDVIRLNIQCFRNGDDRIDRNLAT